MNSNGSSSSLATPVTAIWNQEHAQLPPGYDIKDLKSNIELALKQQNPHFFVEEMLAMGPDTRFQFPDGFTFSPIPREIVQCQSEQKHPDCCGSFQDPDRVDLYVVRKMFMKVLQKKKYILVITGDGDNYETAMKRLDEEDVYVMVAQPEGSSGELYEVTKASWIWNSMINGGQPTHGNGSKRCV